MVDLKTLTEKFTSLPNWQDYIKENFERKAGLYTSVSIKDLRIEIGKEKYIYPRRILFEKTYIKTKKTITRVERLNLSSKPIKAIEKTTVIPFGNYQRKNKYSGDIINILKDILGKIQYDACKFSNNLLELGDAPLYNIDARINWPSYILCFSSRPKSAESITNNLDETKQDQNILSILDEITGEYGIHYSYSQDLKNVDLIIFKIPYLKIIENKIVRQDNSFEKLRLVLEYNDLSIFYTSKLDIKIKCLIKDTNNEILHDGFSSINFEKSMFQIVDIIPEKSGEISFASIEIYINGTLVENRAGYYIRSIKINLKTK